MIHETSETPEELIAAMTTEELQELLEEMGVDATTEQAAGLQALIAESGSLEAALDALGQCEKPGRIAA